ncbi:hypothetical protein FHS04_002529 [Mesoflavibacter sabulilitoris]|uniref:Uncharacterized protein n=1 Tax=Mesoflavibacter zeaxanthinifaciens subsp. sabulilitoris TaxID=1520893 RepID=A0A2T1NBT0_9FLAO|nr:hypothetical protein [Mesoflavibacter zeaxanthinifaciens]MBB3124997.1 hypothetical protein [Mesoflavibacter zeaxanthinifaciens subsp. sabulilitoris]PSG89879.1 hypothetical protein C7H61_08730 [Mesoflavibacter zeaxanthinifaciens subsp. sabulilitoris]
MKYLQKTLLFAALFVLTFSVTAQEKFTLIHKNKNSSALGLKHDLNKVGDTILMTSDKSILRVSFLSHAQKETVMVDLDNKSAKIPLHHLAKGRYTIAVYREDMIIAFDIVRQKEILAVDNSVTDLEESILRSSLSQEEQEKRFIKPLSKSTNKDTRLASSNNINTKNQLSDKEISERDRIKKEREALLKKERAIAKANLIKLQEERAAKQKKEEVAIAEAKKEEELAKQISLKHQEELKLAEENRKKLKEEAEKKRIAEARQKEEEAKRTEIEASKRVMLAQLEKNKKDKANSEKELASNTVKSKKVKYNLTLVNDKSVDVQTREEYRRENLRPNGKPYND